MRGTTGWKHQVKSHFGEGATEWAAYYTDAEAKSLRARHLISRQRFALEMVEAAIPPGSRILDAGCGSGVMAGTLMRRGYAVWGLDFAEPMIRQARELHGSDQLMVGDIEHIPFPDNTFDGVVALVVLDYLESDERALREIRRVLRPGGRAVIGISNGRSPLLHLDVVVQRIDALLRPVDYPFVQDGTRYRRYYRRRWLRLLRGLNFEPEEWICHGWGWFSSPLGRLVQFLSLQQTAFRRGLERLFGRALLSRSSDTFVRSPALNWLASEHIFRVRAIK